MNKVRKIAWIGWTLPIIAGAIVYADLASGHIAKSIFWTVFALVLGAFGLVLYVWASTAPGEPIFLFSGHAHPLKMSAIFFGAVAVFAVVLIRITFFHPHGNWWREFQGAIFMPASLASYAALVALVRYLRSRGQNSTDIQKQTGDFRP